MVKDRTWTDSDEETLHLVEILSSILKGGAIQTNGSQRLTGSSGGNGKLSIYDLPEEEKTWRKQGLCRGLDGGIFFPERGHSMLPAFTVCRGCSVRYQCLESAITRGERWGVWGGFTPEERGKIEKEVKKGTDYKTASAPFNERREVKLRRALARIRAEQEKAERDMSQIIEKWKLDQP